MRFDLERMMASKRAWRRSLAQRPVAEKLTLLDALRDRTRTIRAAAKRQATVLREPPPEYPLKPAKD